MESAPNSRRQMMLMPNMNHVAQIQSSRAKINNIIGAKQNNRYTTERGEIGKRGVGGPVYAVDRQSVDSLSKMSQFRDP